MPLSIRHLLAAYVVGLTMLLTGCATPSATTQKSDCSKADNENWVVGAGECLRIITRNPKSNPDALVILIHGDVSRGGASDYFASRTGSLAPEKNNITTVTMIRPGYFDRANNTSTGTNFNRRDSYTKHNIAAVAEAILTLKVHFKPKRVVIVGHSGGAAMTGVMLGKYPGIADAAVLAACPCYISRWRQHHQARPFVRSLSPHKFVEGIDPSTHVVVMVGDGDKNTYPALSKAYAESLSAKGIKADLKVIEGGSHNSIVYGTEFNTLLLSLAK